MPTYKPHVTLSAQGAINGGERWSCTLAFGSPLALPWTPTQEQLDGFATDGVEAWTAFLEATGTNASTAVLLTRCEARLINTAGVTTLLAQQSPSDTVGGSGPRYLPNQCAIVCSLRTRTPGTSGRGRIFLPILGVTADPTGRLPGTVRDSLATNAQTLLNALNDAAVANGAPETAQLIVASGVGLGNNYPVDSLRIGDVIDTQRRRRDKLVEAYTVRAVSYTG